MDVARNPLGNINLWDDPTLEHGKYTRVVKYRDGTIVRQLGEVAPSKIEEHHRKAESAPETITPHHRERSEDAPLTLQSLA
jgi:hypothetical protein